MFPLILIPATGVGAVLLLIYGAVFTIGVLRRRKNVRLFKGLAAKHRLEFVGAHDFYFDSSPPYLTGKLDGIEVDVFTQPHAKSPIPATLYNRYSTVIRVHSRFKSNVLFTVKRATLVGEAIAALEGKNIKTGDPQFDSLYTLKCNEEQFAIKLFDQFVCEDFVANPGTFQFTPLVFRNGYLEFKEHQLLSSNIRMARIDEIMQFMVHLVEKGDAILKNNQR